LQERLKKRYFDGTKLDLSGDKIPTKIKGIEEYRTMYKHIYNAGKRQDGTSPNYKPLIIEGGTLPAFGRWGSRENYRIANNLFQWAKSNRNQGIK
jgi:hypothetical protein